MGPVVTISVARYYKSVLGEAITFLVKGPACQIEQKHDSQVLGSC